MSEWAENSYMLSKPGEPPLRVTFRATKHFGLWWWRGRPWRSLRDIEKQWAARVEEKKARRRA